MLTDNMIKRICTVESTSGCVNCTLYGLCKDSEKHEEQIRACYKEWRKEDKTFTKDELAMLSKAVKIALTGVKWLACKRHGEYTIDTLKRLEEGEHVLTKLLNKIDRKIGDKE